MSACTEVLAKAAGTKLCDCVVIGIEPDGNLYLDWTGSTLSSLILLIQAANHKAMTVHAQELRKVGA